jgi:hypothetical protein
MAYQHNLKFSYNWNNKLSCAAFTTIRLYNPKKYVRDDVYNIYLKDELVGTAQLVGIRKTKLSSLNEFVARLDTGYSLGQCRQVISRMYGKDKDHDLGLYLFKWVKVNNTASINVKHLRNTVDRLSGQLEEARKRLDDLPLFTAETCDDE